MKYDHLRPQKPLCTRLAPGRGEGRPIRKGCPGVQVGREGRPWAGALGGAWCRPRRGPCPLPSWRRQSQDEDMAAPLGRGLHLLLAEFPDGPPTLDAVLQELAVPLQVARGKQLQVDHQVVQGALVTEGDQQVGH